MIIACPKCETTFSLADELYKPGKKARCSQCGNIFPMPEEAEEDFDDDFPPLEDSGKTKPGAFKKRLPLILAGVGVFFLILLGYGGYMVYSSFTGSGSPKVDPGAPAAVAQQTELERRIMSIGLDEIKQFQVDNANIGKIMVIQGVAVNNSSSNKDFIAVEARLLDVNGKIISRVQQLCGVRPTLFQLQNLGEKELRDVLNRRDTIMINNTNLPPYSRTPFVVVFTKPPQTTRSFEVQVLDVHDSPPQ